MNMKCNNCGGTIHNYTCVYCHLESAELKQLLNTLINYLDTTSLFSQNILFNLYMIKDLQVEEINNVLVKNNFHHLLEVRFPELILKIKNNKMQEKYYEDAINFLKVDIPNELERTFYVII